jgi:hypothetical protein
MKNVLFILLLLGSSLTFAQTLKADPQSELEQFFEGRKVKVKIDMPATKYGIDVYPMRNQQMNFDDYANRLKQFGTAVKEGDSLLITKVKVKKGLIEFQLGGGGFGTAGDDSSTYVSTPSPDKTRREKDLERDLKNITDPVQKKRMKQELDDLRQDRAREEARLRTIALEAEEFKKARVREQAKTAGSRFNIRYDNAIPAFALSPEAVMQALAAYVEFTPTSANRTSANADPATLPRLRKGMSDEEVEQLLGYPNSQSDRQEGKLTVNTWSFKKGNRTIEAEFVNDVLIRYTVREQ